jgi:hypothetical protein
MEKRSRRRTRDLVTQAASQGLSQNEIGCARISMMARSTNAPCKGRIQMRKTNPLHLLKFGLQRTAGPYSWVKTGKARSEQMSSTVHAIMDSSRTSLEVRFVPCVDGSGLARTFFTSQAWSVLPCVRPISAVHMTAGHNALRGSGPGQKHAFDSNAMAQVGCPDRRIDRLCITCCSLSQLHITPVARRDLVYRASAMGSL